MPTVAVVGAGVAGLTAALRICDLRPDATVVVLEASPRIGGKLRREWVAGGWVDVGAEAMLARRPEGIELARRMGMGDALISPLTTSALLRVRGQNVRLPARTMLGIPGDLTVLAASGVLSDASLSAVRAEPSGGPYPALTEDVSVGALVRQRFGDEVVERLVDPLLGGVYAGRADDISLRMALPQLAQRLTDGGSLLDAVAALLPKPTDPVDNLPVFASISGGLARLPEVMAADDRITVRTLSTVRSVRRTGVGFELVIGSAADSHAVFADAMFADAMSTDSMSTDSMFADAVVLASPAGKTAALVAELAPRAAAELASIPTAGVVIVTLAFAAGDATALPPASGVLIPAVEGLPVKAMTFSSLKWPLAGGAPGGVTMLRGSLGRAGEQTDLQRNDAELVEQVRASLATITGVTASPIDTHVQRWGGGLPQYAPGHQDRVRRIRAELEKIGGLAVCGASYDGVGIPACIASALVAADRLTASFLERGQ